MGGPNPWKKSGMKAEAPVEPVEDGRGARFWVRVVPGASRDAIMGWQTDGKLRIRISAPAERGRANKALVRFLARALGVRSSALTVVSGTSSREKRLYVEGVSPERVSALGSANGDP